MSESSFRTFFKTKFPYATKLRAKSDFCDLCCKLKNAIDNKRSDEETREIAKLELLAFF